MPRDYNPMPFWKSFLISSALHAAVFAIPYFLYTPYYKRTENIKENYITIKLHHNPIALTQQVSLGENTISTNPTTPLKHQYTKKEEKTISQNNPENITKSDDTTKSDRLSSIVDKIVNDTREITKMTNGINKELEKFEKDISQELESTTKIFGSLNKQLDPLNKKLDLLLLVLDNKNIQEYFNHTYKPGERNEISYSELWRAYANAYLLVNNKIGKILPILRENKNIEDILSIDVIFEKDGTFRFPEIKMNPEFKDKEDKVYNHYRAVFEKIPKKFISPLECNLPAPYHANYAAKNREKHHNKEGESINLEKLVK